MIPKKERSNQGLSPKDAFVSFAKASESKKVLYREERRKHPLKYIFKYKKGLCSLCKSTDKKIISEKHALCKSCRNWCRSWIIKNYGVFRRQFMSDAIIAGLEPVSCRFHEICGNKIPNIKDGKFLKLNICDQCYIIWADGVKAGRNQKVILRRY